MLNLKYLSRFSRFWSAAFILAVLATVPFRLAAQDDMPEPETISPSSTSNSAPIIMDESDSGSVSDAEEYDG